MVNQAINVLLQLKELLHQLTDAELKSELSVLSSSTVGKHSRHIIEFFKCLLKQTPEGLINYDLRERNENIEIRSAIAVSEIEKSISGLDQLHTGPPGMKLVSGENVIHTMDTSLEREIWYNIEHAIHHMAIIRMAVNHHFPHIKINNDFGVAFSTLQYLEKSNINKN